MPLFGTSSLYTDNEKYVKKLSVKEEESQGDIYLTNPVSYFNTFQTLKPSPNAMTSVSFTTDETVPHAHLIQMAELPVENFKIWVIKKFIIRAFFGS